MRTAAICPTCATYTNAVCVLYDGPYLSNLDIAPLTDLEEIIGIINAKVQLKLGYTPENVANKSTNVLLGTSNTLYPTQNAVKTYVDSSIAAIPTPTLQQVTDVDNVTTQVIYSTNVGNTVRASIQTDFVSGLPQVVLEDDNSGKISSLTSEALSFTNGASINTVKVKATNISSSVKNIELPNASGTLALSVNGNAANTSGNITIPHPNRVYVAEISMVDGSIINLLKNTLGDTLTWVASSGLIATSSSVLANEINTFVSVTSKSAAPKIVSTDVAVSSISWNVAIYQTDNAGAPNSTDSVFVEIRIY
jgi:hypothetical protein